MGRRRGRAVARRPRQRRSGPARAAARQRPSRAAPRPAQKLSQPRGRSVWARPAPTRSVGPANSSRPAPRPSARAVVASGAPRMVTRAAGLSLAQLHGSQRWAVGAVAIGGSWQSRRGRERASWQARRARGRTADGQVTSEASPNPAATGGQQPPQDRGWQQVVSVGRRPRRPLWLHGGDERACPSWAVAKASSVSVGDPVVITPCPVALQQQHSSDRFPFIHTTCRAAVLYLLADALALRRRTKRARGKDPPDHVTRRHVDPIAAQSPAALLGRRNARSRCTD